MEICSTCYTFKNIVVHFDSFGVCSSCHKCASKELYICPGEEEVYRPYLADAAQFEYCNTKRCRDLLQCCYAHSEFEYEMWEEEREILRAVLKPRHFSSLSKCKEMSQNGFCKERNQCADAHSNRELHIQLLHLAAKNGEKFTCTYHACLNLPIHSLILADTRWNHFTIMQQGNK